MASPFFDDLNALDRAVGERRNNPQAIELYGGKTVEMSHYEPDADTFRDEYYYNSRINRLFKKIYDNRGFYFWKPISEA